jgi:integrase
VAIRKFHRPGCPREKSCECPWRLIYRPLGMAGPLKRLNFPTKKLAEKYQAETSVKASRGEYVDPRNVPTFKEAAEVWFSSKLDRRPSHVADLRSRLDKHLLPRFGTQRIDRITVADLEKFRSDLHGAGYARRTVRVIVRILGAIFHAAIRRGECSINPADRIERSFDAARELTKDGHGRTDDTVNEESVLSTDEIRRLLDASDEGYYKTFFSTAFITGMRSGELLALGWDDVAFDDATGRGEIFVRKTLSWARANRDEPVRPRFYPPKTKAGVRTISIPPVLVAALKIWKSACPPSEQDLVFPHVDGQPNHRDRILMVGFYPALRRAGLRRVVFHSLRHSCASAMIAAGAPVTEVQHRLGHASPAITLQVYSHWFRDSDSGTADLLADAICRPISSVHKVCTEARPAQVASIAGHRKSDAA